MIMPNATKDIPGCWLDIMDLDKDPRFQAAYDRVDNNTLHTGLSVEARNGFRFTWWGVDAGTVLNKIYGQAKITATHEDGGSVTDEGTTEIAWKHD